MNFCENCGHKREARQKFCQGCGLPIGTQSSASKNEVEHDQGQQTDMTRSSHQKKAPKGLLIAAVIVLVLSLAGYFTYSYGENYYSRTNQVDRLVTILNSGEYDDVAAVISPAQSDLEITEETIKPFVDTYITNADAREIRESLLYNGSYEGVHLVSQGNYLFLYDKYELQLQPSFVTLTTNMDEVVLSIDNEDITVSDSEAYSYTYGPMVPGEYTFSAAVNLDGEHLYTEESQLAYAGQDNVYVDLPIYGLSFYVESNIDDALVYLNGQNIGQLQSGSGQFGPYASLEGAQLDLRKEESFGEMKTSSSTLTDYDNESYYLRFDDVMTVQDAEIALWNMYQNLSTLTQSFQFNLERTIENFGLYFYEGIAYDELRPFFIDYAKRQRDNEDTDGTSYEVRLSNFEQVGMKEYQVDMEVDYITSYGWSTGKDDRIRTFSYTVSLVADEAVRDTWTYDEELYISGFASEKLIYDSND